MWWRVGRHTVRWGRRWQSTGAAETTPVSPAGGTEMVSGGQRPKSLKMRMFTGAFGTVVLAYIAVKAYRVMVYMPHALPSNSQLWHAWLASHAACCENPAEFLNRPYIRPLHSFFVVAPTTFENRRMQLVWCETKDDVYIGVAGPASTSQQPARDLLTTEPMPEGNDVSGAECAHTTLPTYASHIPLNAIYDMVFLQSKPLYLCGHGMGGAIAHMCLLSNLFGNTHGVSPYFAKVRSIAFGAPYIAGERIRRYADQRNWKHMFVNVVNNSDPMPFVYSALMDPTLREKASSSDRKQLDRLRDLLNKLIADPEIDNSERARRARQKLEAQVTAELAKVRPLLPEQKADYRHFKPLGRWCFLRSTGEPGVPPESSMAESKVEIRQAAEQRRVFDAPAVADHGKRAYFQTLVHACGVHPALELPNPVLSVAWPFRRQGLELAAPLDPSQPGLLRSEVPPAVQHYQRENPSTPVRTR